jgi:hypothetical protein
MTAIFALWNTNGFSLAADSNQTINEPGQIWIDPIQKIFPLDNHQVAFGGAGDGSVDLVDVNVLISTWAKKLSTPLPNLEDYLVSFLEWFNDQNLPSAPPTLDATEFDENLEEAVNALNEGFPNFKKADPEQILEFLATALIVPKSVLGLNIYGGRYSQLEINNLSYESEVDALSYGKLSDINTRVRNHRINSENYSISMAESRERYFGRASQTFPEIVGEVFDPTLDWHVALIDSLIELHENLVFPDASFARCMLIGYGEEDWIPRAVVFRMYNSDWGVRQVAIERVYDPRAQWYVSIGISSGISDLARGFSNDFQESLLEISSETLDEPTSSDLMGRLFELGRERFNRSLTRIDSLTVRRLEFVARLFVELEALKSYLNEPLPGVGGDVQYITMTKNSTKSGVYHEYN